MLDLCYSSVMTEAEDFEILPFGLAIKRRRRNLGLTQDRLAELLDVDQTTVSKWERRTDPLTDDFQVEAIAELLELSSEDLRAGKIPVRTFKFVSPKRVPVQEPARSESEEVESYIRKINMSLLRLSELDKDSLPVLDNVVVAFVERAEKADSEERRAARNRKNSD